MTALPRTSRRRVATLAAAALLAGTAAAVAPTASAAPGHAPDPPRSLTVDDRDRHLNVEGTPEFGWLPQDKDPGEVQTAYQVVVRDGRDNAVVWDSGKVASAKQSYVAYGGPALEAGSPFTWTVRTWDRSNQASPAARGEFDTGISDSQWDGAQWIRRTTTDADDYTLARKVVSIGSSRVTRATAYTAADQTYELYLDGKRADRGTSFGYPGEDYYQAADVTRLVKPGKDLAIGALYHWYGSGQGRPAGNRGLLVKLDVEHADGSREVVTTDGTWKVTQDAQFPPGSARRNGEGDRIERQDARAELVGWKQTGYDDSAWTPATVVGPHPERDVPAPDRAGDPHRRVARQAGQAAHGRRRDGRRRLRRRHPGAAVGPLRPGCRRSRGADPRRLQPHRDRTGGHVDPALAGHRHELPVHAEGRPADLQRVHPPRFPLPGGA